MSEALTRGPNDPMPGARYEIIRVHQEEDPPIMCESDEGGWVAYEDYAALRDQVAQVTAEREKALNDVYIPGNWFCPQCQFAQSITNLYVNSGTFGPNTDQVPLCPNDGTLMKRERWQDQVMSFDKALTQKMDECDALQRQLADASATIERLEKDNLAMKTELINQIEKWANKYPEFKAYVENYLTGLEAALKAKEES